MSFQASAKHPIVRCYFLLHYSEAAAWHECTFLHIAVLHCRDLQPFNAVVGTEISSSWSHYIEWFPFVMVAARQWYTCSASVVMRDWYDAAMRQLLQHVTRLHYVGHTDLWLLRLWNASGFPPYVAFIVGEAQLNQDNEMYSELLTLFVLAAKHSNAHRGRLLSHNCIPSLLRSSPRQVVNRRSLHSKTRHQWSKPT